MKRQLTFLTAVVGQLLFSQSTFSAAPSLDEMLRHPGDYSQVCDIRTSSFPAPIPGFCTILHGEANFSQENIALIKKHRTELLPQISAKLAAIDLTKKTQPQEPEKLKNKNPDECDATPVGVDPAVLSNLLVNLIEELDAYEVFPQLLAVENRFHEMLTAAEKNPKASLPQTDGVEGAGIGAMNLYGEDEDYEKMTEARKAEVERTRSIFYAQNLHRDILAVMVKSMRKHGYEPMLTSELEKTYGTLRKAQSAKNESLSKFKTANDIPEAEREDIKFDPIHQVAYYQWDAVNIPYTEEIRQNIVTLTKSYVTNLIK
jgi:hypothetical protein